ncbi:DUF805 domain-containing protein [Thalassobellus suaedae]|uniref:DUF805 domain-containing protein n=1 Tax=Thalassobellus suaedae TaxID=3074124 RepID=A0ABY9Y093_9FLAO|nr:DUF805 domain-containing protein [Flavobacteriaceae bacterium HL-DH10]
MFKKPFSFKGRIRRTEYGLSYLIYVIIGIGVGALTSEFGQLSPFILMLIWIPLYWFLLSQGAKRCHDRGNSGWYQIIPFYALWMLFADSEVGSNEYGDNPKGIGNGSEIDDIGKAIENE